MIRKIKTAIAIFTVFTCVTALTACGNEDTDYEYDDEIYDELEEYEGEYIDEYAEEYGEEYGEYEEYEGYDGDMPDGYGVLSEQARNLMYEEYEKMKAEVLEDPVRQKEVSPEVTTIRCGGDGDPITETDIPVCTIELDGRKMLYTMNIIGEPDDNGMYPLYITLHGGGEADPELNNGQWLAMKEYYTYGVQNGIYVAVRGMEDVWNLHFLDDSYPMYDRLIEDMVFFFNANPDKVYLLGFSAGGDGVFAIAPRMADRFAAVNMSSGHPNGVSLINVSNLPFEIQVGVRDFYSETALRCIRSAEFEETLNNYSQIYGHPYPHRVLVHVPYGHNFNDCYSADEDLLLDLSAYDLEDFSSNVLKDPAEYARRAEPEDFLGQFMDIFTPLGKEESVSLLSYCADTDYGEVLFPYITDTLHLEVERNVNTNAVDYVNQFTRDASPTGFTWDLSTRAPKRKDTAFYWLKADFSVNQGVINASYDSETNTVRLEPSEGVNGPVKVLVSPFMMDLDMPLTIETPYDTMTVDLKVDKDIIDRALEETGDIYLSWADEVTVNFD